MIDTMILRYFLFGMIMYEEIDLCFCCFRCCCRQGLVFLAFFMIAEYERHYYVH
jgi:hypothetical protein